MRPKYVRRQGNYAAGDGGGEGGGTTGEGQELSVWIRAGVTVSRLLDGRGAACALCRKCGRGKKKQVRGDTLAYVQTACVHVRVGVCTACCAFESLSQDVVVPTIYADQGRNNIFVCEGGMTSSGRAGVAA